MNLKEWQNSGSTVRIQNPSLLTSGIKDMGTKNTTYGGMLPTNAQGYVSILPVDVNTRVPAKYTAGNYQFTVYGDNGASSYDSYTFENVFCGQGNLSLNIIGNSTILDFMPRMYVRLKKFSEFRDEFLNPSGYVGHFSARPIFNDYAAAKTYGYKFDSENISSFADDMYILAGYTLVTNKTDGTTQTDIYSYDYSTYTNSSIDIYDTWIPCDLKGTNYWAQGSAFIPYMRSLMTVRHYPDVNDGFYYYGKMPLYVGINGMISGGKAINAVNMFSVTASGGFSENPFMYANSDPFNKHEWGILTSYPNNCQLIHYIVASKSTWKNLLNASGMAWSEDYNIVISPDGKGLNKPTFPGQPTNPVDTGDGDGDNISDTVEYPELLYIPNSTVYDRYFLSPNQIVDVKKFLFSDTFIDNIKRIWTNPAEYVISLCFYPFDVVNSNIITTDTLVSVGGITSEVSALAATDSGLPYFYGGSVEVGNYYNSYLDYEPYTSIDIYIPYIGVRPLNVSQIVGHRLCIGYYIDFNTQQITALIGLDGDSSNLGQVVTQYIGTVGVNTPLSGTSAQDVTRNIVTQTAGLITGVGALAGGVATGNIAAAAVGASSTVSTLTGRGHTSPNYYGSLSPISGLISPQSAYLIINRPIAAEPEKFKEQVGYSSCYSSIGLGAYSGFLKCAAVDIPANSNMTEEEQKEIESLLLGGIYIE